MFLIILIDKKVVKLNLVKYHSGIADRLNIHAGVYDSKTKENRKMTIKDQINLFDNDSDTSMYKHKITLEKINNELINFGLTKSQAKVFIYLGKYGSKTASEVSKALQLPRTETYNQSHKFKHKKDRTSDSDAVS